MVSRREVVTTYSLRLQPSISHSARHRLCDYQYATQFRHRALIAPRAAFLTHIKPALAYFSIISSLLDEHVTEYATLDA